MIWFNGCGFDFRFVEIFCVRGNVWEIVFRFICVFVGIGFEIEFSYR